MRKRASSLLSIMFFLLALTLVVSGCAKKQMVKEGAGQAPAPKMEAETQPAAPTSAPKMEAETQPAPTSEPSMLPAPQEPAIEAESVPKSGPVEETQPMAFDLTTIHVQFAFDDSSLSGAARETLAKVASWMSENPETKIQIQGNTCDIGTDEYNLALGEMRAQSAKEYLERSGVAAERIATISYGEEKPLVPDTSEANRIKNRRDDFLKAG